MAVHPWRVAIREINKQAKARIPAAVQQIARALRTPRLRSVRRRQRGRPRQLLGDSRVYPSAAETAGSAVGAELSRLGADVTRRNLNVQPTIKVPVGYRFNVRVNRDLLFEALYRPFRM